MPSLRLIPRPSMRDLSTFLLAPHLLIPCSHLTSFPTRRSPSIQSSRKLSSSASSRYSAPKSHDRGPSSTETTQTDFGSLNVLGATPAPSTSIDACLWDGFHLNSGLKVNGSGVLLVGGEAFAWRPWEAAGEEEGKRLVNGKGQWGVDDTAWGLLGLMWPKPDLLILGLGKEMRPLSPATRQFLQSLGIRVDIQDTRNAAAQFNLLATERGVTAVAAALVPLGWREGVGLQSGS